MQEGDYIYFNHNNTKKSGKIAKIFTQIGFEDHGEKMVVILVDNSNGLFNEESSLILKLKDLQVM
jgi:hypothetical protein